MGTVSENAAAADAQRQRQGQIAPQSVTADHAAFKPLALPAVVAAAHMASRGRQRGSGAAR
ncbi:MAG: hypothetical protein MEP57_08485 [Microvirga sp.]|nr:hypothetical protein [Microvirga sp.]